MPDLMPGKRHIADANQNAAEPHPVISAAVSMNDFMSFLIILGKDSDYGANLDHLMVSNMGLSPTPSSPARNYFCLSR